MAISEIESQDIDIARLVEIGKNIKASKGEASVDDLNSLFNIIKKYVFDNDGIVHTAFSNDGQKLIDMAHNNHQPQHFFEDPKTFNSPAVSKREALDFIRLLANVCALYLRKNIKDYEMHGTQIESIANLLSAYSKIMFDEKDNEFNKIAASSDSTKAVAQETHADIFQKFFNNYLSLWDGLGSKYCPRELQDRNNDWLQAYAAINVAGKSPACKKELIETLKISQGFQIDGLKDLKKFEDKYGKIKDVNYHMAATVYEYIRLLRNALDHDKNTGIDFGLYNISIHLEFVFIFYVISKMVKDLKAE